MTPSRRPLLNLIALGPSGAGVTTLTRRLSGGDGGTFSGAERNYVVIDVSDDSRTIMQQMMQGSVVADGAVLVIDALGTKQGDIEDSARLISLLGVDQVVIALNKSDRASGPAALDEARERARQTLVGLNLDCVAIVPVSAQTGENVGDSITERAEEGPSLIQSFEGFEALPSLSEQPLRLPIDNVANRLGARLWQGRLKSGTLVEGDQVMLSPSNRTARVARIQLEDGERYAHIVQSGDRVSLMPDADADVAAGELLSHVENAPVETDVCRARMWWQGERPLVAGSKSRAEIGGQLVEVEVQSIEHVFDSAGLLAPPSGTLTSGQIGEAVLRFQSLIALDTMKTCPANARVRFFEGDAVSGEGSISMAGYADQRHAVTMRATNVTRVAHQISTQVRTERHNHQGGVLWFTGLSGAGKSTLAVEVEQALFDGGYEVYVLDGDNVRHGLNADLGFSPEDRSENIRRIGEVAALFSRAGVVAISAFISPYRSDRARARAAAGDAFHEIHISAPIEVCERRDPKGLYARARAGELKEFTGVSAPYESPESPDLVVDTAIDDVETCVRKVVEYVESVLSLNGKGGMKVP